MDIKFEEDAGEELSIFKVMENVPQESVLLLIDALLFAVYGWTPNKVKKMKLSSIKRWVEYAKKRMTWGDAYKLRRLIKPKEKSWLKKLLKIKS